MIINQLVFLSSLLLPFKLFFLSLVIENNSLLIPLPQFFYILPLSVINIFFLSVINIIMILTINLSTRLFLYNHSLILQSRSIFSKFSCDLLPRILHVCLCVVMFFSLTHSFRTPPAPITLIFHFHIYRKQNIWMVFFLNYQTLYWKLLTCQSYIIIRSKIF